MKHVAFETGTHDVDENSILWGYWIFDRIKCIKFILLFSFQDKTNIKTMFDRSNKNHILFTIKPIHELDIGIIISM